MVSGRQHFARCMSVRFFRGTIPHQFDGGHATQSAHIANQRVTLLELQEALRALLTELPGLKLAGDIMWKTKMIVRGPRTMPVGW